MLEIAALDTWRGPAQILRQVTLGVGKGECVCLVGRNGAGKTTTMDSIMGLLPSRSGKVTLQGRDISGLPPHQRARLGIGHAPEDGGVFPDLTVNENLQISLWMTRTSETEAQARERIFALFPEVRPLLQRRGLYLSGGEKKMVAIAQAMALSPAILLLDEPFEGLAPVVVTRIIDAVKKIKAMGISLLIAESNLINASRIADRLYAIDRGEIIFQGDPKQVFDNEDVMKTIRG